jgi:hypothetical protein
MTFAIRKSTEDTFVRHGKQTLGREIKVAESGMTNVDSPEGGELRLVEYCGQ